ncbi:MAG: trypsin-like peptidase domain-containing protein [Phycisphaerae bacterium]|nr:trypsin-like peptidase domain-containing protein [Phycisphaerae bacterium]
MRSFRLADACRLLVAAAAVAALGGCLARDRAEAAQVFGPLRAESLKAWTDVTISGEPAIEYAISKSALILEDADSASAELVVKPDGDTRAVLMVDRRGQRTTNISFGSAVPIASDGYYLTAAHVVELDNSLLLARHPGGPYLETKLRRVWSGTHLSPELDVAIVHAPGLELAAVPWAPLEELTLGAKTIAAGLGGKWPRTVGGTISSVLSYEPTQGGRPPVTRVEIRGPYIPGDSGGPTFLADGRLVGIAVSITFAGRADPDDAVTCRLLRLDPEWVDALIARDRASRPTTAAPRAKPSDAHALFETLDERTLDVDGWLTPTPDTPRPPS